MSCCDTGQQHGIKKAHTFLKSSVRSSSDRSPQKNYAPHTTQVSPEHGDRTEIQRKKRRFHDSSSSDHHHFQLHHHPHLLHHHDEHPPPLALVLIESSSQFKARRRVLTWAAVTLFASAFFLASNTAPPGHVTIFLTSDNAPPDCCLHRIRKPPLHTRTFKSFHNQIGSHVS